MVGRGIPGEVTGLSSARLLRLQGLLLPPRRLLSRPLKPPLKLLGRVLRETGNE